MKIATSKIIFPVNTSHLEDSSEKTVEKKMDLSSKAVKTMPDELVIPPARVWNKIEAILDQQDKLRKKASNMLSSSFGLNKPVVKQKKVYFATVGGISLVAGLLWIIV